MLKRRKRRGVKRDSGGGRRKRRKVNQVMREEVETIEETRRKRWKRQDIKVWTGILFSCDDIHDDLLVRLDR